MNNYLPKKCVQCSKIYKPKATNQKYCSYECRIKMVTSKNQIATKNIRIKIQKNVFSLFGNKCMKCGYADVRALTLDHIESISKTGFKRKGTITILNEIKNNPIEGIKKFQLLCRNCNWIKAIKNNELGRQSIKPFAYKYEIEELENRISEIELKMTKKIDKDSTENISPSENISPLSDTEIIKKVTKYKHLIFNRKRQISGIKLKAVIERKLGIKITHTHCYKIKAIMEIEGKK